MCVDQLLLFMNFWFGVILCIHYVSCVCHYGIPTICILSCFHMCLLTQSLSLSLFIPHCFRSRYIIESIRSFIHSFDGEGVIFIRSMFCCYGLYHEKCLFVIAKGGQSLNGIKSYLPMCWLLVVYPDCPYHLVAQSSVEVYWGFYYKEFYISLCCCFLFCWLTPRGARMCEEERAYFYRFVCFFWSLVGWECRMTVCCECAPNQFALSLSCLVAQCHFILLLIFSLSFILLLFMYSMDGEWNAVCLPECPSLFFHFISFFQCEAPNTVWSVYSFWKRLHGFWERTTSTIPLLIGSWFNESIQFVVFDVIPCR